MSRKLVISALVAGGTLAVLGRKSSAGSIATVNRLFTEDFDPLFQRRCPGIPLPFLRSLAKHESNFNPKDDFGPARGLLQVVEVVRNGYNRRFKTEFSRPDLLNPEINVEIACELLTRISKVLPKNHPGAIPSPSWADPRFVGLVTLAWNAGFSEAVGMGFVLGVMEDAGFRPEQITIDSVHQVALQTEKAGRFLKVPGRVEFARRVVRDYMSQIVQL